LVGAVSQEVRNVCGAIAVVHENLARSGALAQNKDFEALGTLILALEKIAAMDLRQTTNQAASVDLQALLEELRIVVEPSLRERDIELKWAIEPALPVVWADRQSLMQVFLNLTKNSERALLSQPRRELSVTARVDQQRVVIRFRDTGCGVGEPERLFRPFQHGAQATGLGLYLSRAMTRSFRGDLRYEPEPQGSSFIVELSPAISESMKETYGTADPAFAGGRSQPLPGQPQPVTSSRT
jgi:signal transduction histidine kinase